MACSADINVSQIGVATYAKCGGILNIHLSNFTHHQVIERENKQKTIYNKHQNTISTLDYHATFKLKFTKKSSSEKVFFESVEIWQNYGREYVAHLFGPPTCLRLHAHIRRMRTRIAEVAYLPRHGRSRTHTHTHTPV